MRILHVAHQQWRKYGYNRVSWAQKLYNGFIKNNHTVQAFSDRDIAAFEAPLGIRSLGAGKANKRLLKTVRSFEPDLVVVGHCDIISNETLKAIRSATPNTVIAVCNNDPVFVPENAEKIKLRCKVADVVFVSTGERELKQFETKKARLKHMPNSVDIAVEPYDVSKNAEFTNDLIFCSKETKHSNRGELVSFLTEKTPADLRFVTPGSFDQESVWGRDYDRLLGASKMALNLNRQEGLHWYSSARMAQLVGNGLLTFTHESAEFDELFPAETLVYFKNKQDLLKKINCFHHEDAERRLWASNARAFFHSELNSTLHAQYVVEASMGFDYSHPYVWERNN